MLTIHLRMIRIRMYFGYLAIPIHPLFPMILSYEKYIENMFIDNTAVSL